MPRLRVRENSVTVRMYRQGHGDCFLLALPRDDSMDPVYVLIDCGVKPGSQNFIHRRPIGDIVKDIAEATGHHLDLVIVTHEHQDHLNGIWRKRSPYFAGFTIEEAWMAWTENPGDPIASELRRRHRDQILSLVAARQRMALDNGDAHVSVRRIDALLDIELGGEGAASSEVLRLAAADPEAPASREALEASVNKQALKLIRDKASESGHRGVRYLEPGGKPVEIDGTSVRAFVLGPPRDPDLLSDEEPKGSEAFPDDNPLRYTFAMAARAVDGDAEDDAERSPFSNRFAVPFDRALDDGGNPFFRAHYGRGDDGTQDPDSKAVPDSAPWRRIDNEWLYSAEALALKLNTGVNNTSLVLGFELQRSRKVLLFAGDAQRGNWRSWGGVQWRDGATAIDARDLLARTVLYKVSHHGSHNATLAGSADDDWANLAWMGHGPLASEFTAMIPAVSKWARTKNRPPWIHPLPSIQEELIRKAQGRVFQTDVDQPDKPDPVTDASWEEFLGRSAFETLYFDYTIEDAP